MAKYIELDKVNFEKVIQDGISVVDFWAPWCRPCRAYAPVIEELATDFENDMNINICKVNTDDNADLAMKFNIRSIPATIIFKDGKIQEQLVGTQSKEFLKDKINSIKG